MATIGQIAVDWIPRRYKQKQLDVKNNNSKLNDLALIALTCSASQLLKFLKFNVYCIQCTNVEEIIENYSKVTCICDDKDQSAYYEILNKFARHENVHIFSISESIITWFERLKFAGFPIVKDVFASAFSAAKPLREVMYHAK